MKENTLTRRKMGLREFLWMCTGALLILIFVTFIYILEPFSVFWNDLLSNLITIFVAGTSATFATRVFKRFDPSDQPRRVWKQFATGLWLWTIAEVIWGIYNVRYGEVGITAADFFWVLAYGLFAHAIHLQYQLVFHPAKRENMFWIFIWVGIASLLTLFIAWLLIRFTGESWGLPLLLAAFYPAGDLAVGFSALRIARRFRGGALGYPWLGLFVFAIADVLFAILEFGGFYSWSITAGNLWSTAADVIYVAAYLFVALGCFAQLLLLKYGPIFIAPRKEVKE